jgi:hypothetical protein
VLPILSADRGAVHLEGRHQHEDRDTFSAWGGWNLSAGKRLPLELVPMVGVIMGQTKGVAPGLELTLSRKSLELYSENEYVFDVARDRRETTSTPGPSSAGRRRREAPFVILALGVHSRRLGGHRLGDPVMPSSVAARRSCDIRGG